MNRNLVIGIVSFCIFCLGMSFFMTKVFSDSVEVSKSAFKFVRDNIPPALATWDAKKIEPVAHPNLLRENPTEQTQKTFDELKVKLGKFERVEKWKLQAFDRDFELGGKTTVAAIIEGNGVFEKGNAYVEVTLVRSETKWQLARLMVRDVASVRTK